MRWILVMLLIVMTPSNVIGADGSDEFYDVKSIPSDDRDDTLTEFNSTLAIPYKAQKSQLVEITHDEPLILDPLEAKSHNSLDLIEAEYDHLGYENFSETLDEGSGTFDISFNNETEKTTLTQINTIYSNIYTLKLNREISGQENLLLNLASLDFTLYMHLFGYFAVDFEFDTFIVSYVFAATPSYSDFMVNESGMIRFNKTDQSDVSHSVVDLAQAVGTDLPQLLEDVKFHSYHDEIYNITASFGYVQLLQELSDLPVEEGSFESYISLDVNETMIIRPQPDVKARISFQRVFNSITELAGMLNPYSGGLLFSGTLVLPYLPFGYSGIIFIDHYLRDININSTNGYNGTHLLLTGQDVVHVMAKLRNVKSPNLELPPLLQGNDISLKINGELKPEFVLYHSLSSTMVIGEFLRISIPTHWSRGPVYLMGWYKNGTVFAERHQLSLSPAEIMVNSWISIEPVSNKILPVNLKNITDNRIHPATYIEVHHNRSGVEIFGEAGIMINPGRIQDGEVLIVYASREGFVPVSVTIQITVKPFDPTMEVDVSRNDRTSASLSLYLQDFSNWTSTARLHVWSDTVNITEQIRSSFTQVQILSEEWDIDENMTLSIQIVVDGDHYSPIKQVEIPKFDPSAEGGTGSTLWLASVISISLTALMGIGVKIYQKRLTGEIMSF